MVKTKRLAVFLSLLCLVVAGCATWQYIPGRDETWKRSYFEATLPSEWVKYNGPELLILTKDGLELNRISVVQHKMDSDKEFPQSKKKIEKDMLAQDIAQLIVNEISLDREALLNLEVLENKPAQISGVEGFKLVYTYNTNDFLKYKHVFYGFIWKKNFYSIEFLATQQHYFDTNVNDFDSFVSSFVVKDK